MDKKRDYKKKPVNMMDVQEMVMMSDLFRTPARKFVVLRILKYDGTASGKVWFSQKKIAGTGVGNTTISGVLKQMEDLGFMQRTTGRGALRTEADLYWHNMYDAFRDWYKLTSPPSEDHLSSQRGPYKKKSPPGGDKEHTTLSPTYIRTNKRIVETFSPEVEKSPDGVFFRGDKNSNPSERDSISEEEEDNYRQHMLDSQGSC